MTRRLRSWWFALRWTVRLLLHGQRAVDELTAEIEAMKQAVWREACEDSMRRHWPAFRAYWRRVAWGEEDER